jgi:hypothetical protein
VIEASDGEFAARQEFTLTVSDSTVPLTNPTVLRTPAWGAVNIPIDTEFSWETIDGATLYELQVTTKSDLSFETPMLDQSEIDGTATTNSLVYYTASGLPEAAQLIWRVRAQNASGFSPWSDVSQYRTSGTTTPTEEAEELPATAELFQNYPNPFNPSTTIAFELPSASDVTLTIFDLMGREVATVASGMLSAGRHEVRWDAGRLASGMYVYRLRAGSFVKSKTLSLVK